MDQAVEHSRMELAKVRTGRANPDLLNSIQVEYYGSMMPLNQVSNISVPEPRLITIQPFEKSLISVIEKERNKYNENETHEEPPCEILFCDPPSSVFKYGNGKYILKK